MTDYNMNNYAGEVAEPSLKHPKGDVNGKLRVIRDKMILSAAAAVNDEYLMGLIPAGSTIVDAKVIIDKSLGATGIFTLGYKAFTDSEAATVAEDANALVLSADGGGQAVMARMGAGCAGYGKKIGFGGAQIFAIATEIMDGAVLDAVLEIEVTYINA